MIVREDGEGDGVCRTVRCDHRHVAAIDGDGREIFRA